MTELQGESTGMQVVLEDGSPGKLDDLKKGQIVRVVFRNNYRPPLAVAEYQGKNPNFTVLSNEEPRFALLIRRVGRTEPVTISSPNIQTVIVLQPQDIFKMYEKHLVNIVRAVRG